MCQILGQRRREAASRGRDRAGAKPCDAPSEHSCPCSRCGGDGAGGAELGAGGCGELAWRRNRAGGKGWDAALPRDIRRVPKARARPGVTSWGLVSAKPRAGELPDGGGAAQPREPCCMLTASSSLSRSQILACPTFTSRTSSCRPTAAALSTHPPKSSTGGPTRARRYVVPHRRVWGGGCEPCPAPQELL